MADKKKTDRKPRNATKSTTKNGKVTKSAAVAGERALENTATVIATSTVEPAAKPTISEHDVRAWIAVAAYYRAERRHFQGGDPDADWLQAEVEIRERLAQAEHAQA